MNWVAMVADRIRQNLKWSPASDSVKEQIVAEALDEFENPPAPEESALEKLRAEAHEFGQWEKGRWE